MSNINYPVSAQEVLNYLGFDISDTMVSANINRLIPVADSYLKGAIGEDYPVEDPRVKELALLVIADFYENRTTEAKVSNNVRRLVESIELQLRLELRRAGNE